VRQAVVARLALDRAAVLERLHELLDEQRVSLRLRENVALDGNEANVLAHEPIDQRAGVRLSERKEVAAERRALCRPSALRPLRYHEQDAGVAEQASYGFQNQFGFGVGPVEVLNQDQQRRCPLLVEDQRLDRLDYLIAASGRRQIAPIDIVAR